MDSGGKQLSMERVELPQLHEHPLIPFNRFAYTLCQLCSSPDECSSPTNNHINRRAYVYGGYRCNELGCEEAVFHKDCANPLKEINHSFHPHHSPLKLIIPTLPLEHSKTYTCFLGDSFQVGYCCTMCDFKLCLECARLSIPLVLPGNPYGHQHQLKLVSDPDVDESEEGICKVCAKRVYLKFLHFGCQDCEEFVIHVYCREVYHMSHPQHPLKLVQGEVLPRYADKECLLCKEEFDERYHKIHHCDVCNFSICGECMDNPPPVAVECPKTHEHQLYLVPRLLKFICNACGTKGDQSPYLCLQCNFMIHRDCIDLPRVVSINRHDHHISYTPRLGHGENWKCKVCRQRVDGFYGGYTCSKCPTFAVHARCATRKDVWDMVEREGAPEEEEIPPYEVIDANTIRHFSHDHHLQFNKDGMILPESTLCKACVFQIGAEPFYICKQQQQCDFVLHEKCANLPRNKRHVCNNLPFKLHTDPHYKFMCWFCRQDSTGFRYESGNFKKIDVRCASVSDSIEHESHPHPLYYSSSGSRCSRCWNWANCLFRCDECEGYKLDGKCALLPEKIMKNRYDDHPLFLSYGDMNEDETYWCEACETKVYPRRGFYTCNDCGVVLHISCVFGDFSYIMPGTFVQIDYEPGCYFFKEGSTTSSNEEVVSNNSSCRKLCTVCKSRCKLPSVLKVSKGENVVYICSLACYHRF